MEKRKTINGEDILFAMTTLGLFNYEITFLLLVFIVFFYCSVIFNSLFTGFDNYVEPLKIYLQKYREATKGDRTHIEEVYENKVFSKYSRFEPGMQN